MYTHLTVAVLTAVVVYFVVWPVAIYFRDKKGFRKYPNMNWIAGISDLGFMWEAHKQFRSKRLAELHQKHPIIRIGPNSLSFAGGDAIKDIYGHGSPCSKDRFYSVLAGSHYHLADVVDKPEHARKRKMMAAAYALKNLEEWEHKVADKTVRFLRAADTVCTAPLPMGQTHPDVADLAFDYRSYTNFFTLDAIADIGLSELLGFLDAGDDECDAEDRTDGSLRRVKFREALYATARAQSEIVWAYDWYKFNVWLSKLLSPRYFSRLWKLNENWNDIVYHRATKRLSRYDKGEKLSDFFQVLMEDQRSGQPHNLEWGELVAETSIMMNAGSDTTALAMANVMYLLLKNPGALCKLRAEVDAALLPDEAVAPYQKVKYLPYLRAVLDEALRVIPPTTFGLPRRTPAEGLTIGGQFVPGDTSVSISAYVAHRDASLFPEPEAFRPERWLGDEAKALQSGFIPFSTGARGCIGRNISYLEQTVLLASVVHRYELALTSPDWEPERVEGTTYQMGKMPVKIWRRDPAALGV